VRPDWQALQDAIAGEVALPGSAAYDEADAPFNTRFLSLRPAAIVRCAAPEDVVSALGFVARHGLSVVPRSGGHCFAGQSSTAGVVLDVSPMQSVVVDGDLVTVGAGARLGVVYDALDRLGLAVPAGTCPGVGIAGLTLGGGLGVLGRTYGVTSDRLVAAEVVLTDGRIVTCDRHHHDDLFWALRGAGAGTFGVVTSLVLRTVPAPIATNFHMSWPFADAAAVIAAWQKWAPIAPDELYASLKITASEDPDQPPSVDVYGMLQRPESTVAPRMATLLDQTKPTPAHATNAHVSFASTRDFWSHLPTTADPVSEAGALGEGAEQVHFVGKSEFFRRELPAEGIAAVLERFVDGRVAGEARELDFMPWGGAFNRVPEHETAFAHRAELFQLKHSAVLAPHPEPAAHDAAHRFVTYSWTAVHPWASGRVFPNFPDPDLPDPSTAYYGPNLARLRAIKARYDPGTVFRPL
jgi:FAD/FMN-containing dehydrogenase